MLQEFVPLEDLIRCTKNSTIFTSHVRMLDSDNLSIACSMFKVLHNQTIYCRPNLAFFIFKVSICTARRRNGHWNIGTGTVASIERSRNYSIRNDNGIIRRAVGKIQPPFFSARLRCMTDTVNRKAKTRTGSCDVLLYCRMSNDKNHRTNDDLITVVQQQETVVVVDNSYIYSGSLAGCQTSQGAEGAARCSP